MKNIVALRLAFLDSTKRVNIWSKSYKNQCRQYQKELEKLNEKWVIKWHNVSIPTK